MAYDKQTFSDGQVLLAAQLNHMEDGIAAAVRTVNNTAPDKNGNVTVAVDTQEPPVSVDLSQYESAGKIVETFADGTAKTTTVEFDDNGKPVKITDSAGNVTNLTW